MKCESNTCLVNHVAYSMRRIVCISACYKDGKTSLPTLKAFLSIFPMVLRSCFGVIFQVLFTALVSLRGREQKQETVETKAGGRRYKGREERKRHRDGKSHTQSKELDRDSVAAEFWSPSRRQTSVSSLCALTAFEMYDNIFPIYMEMSTQRTLEDFLTFLYFRLPLKSNARFLSGSVVGFFVVTFFVVVVFCLLGLVSGCYLFYLIFP